MEMETDMAEPRVEKINNIDKWKVESAASTLQEAMEIAKDKKLLKAALKVVKEKQAASKEVISWAANL